MLVGRPYGGLGIVWHSKFNNVVLVCKYFGKRYCAVRVIFGAVKLTLICVYFSIDDHSDSPNQELLDTLNCLKTFIYSLDVDCIVLRRDFNTDFSRNNAQPKCVLNFRERVNVTPFVSFMSPSKPYTRLQDKFHSFTNHIAVSGGFANVSYCFNLIVCDDCLSDVNLSDHLGLGFHVNLGVYSNKQGNKSADHSTSYA